MENKQQQARLGNLVIDGIGTAASGKYAHVEINGVGTLTGDIESDTVRANGHLRTQGSIKANRLNCDGTLKINGDLKAGEARINGTGKITNALSGDKLEVNGNLSVGGDCELEHCVIKGGFTVGGLLNAGTLKLDVFARCQAREIGGEIIRVRKTSGKWHSVWKWLFPSYTSELHVNTIEGDDIELQVTIASVVRGNRVVIGKGCTIGRVEYSGELRVLPGASVGEEIKTNDNNNFA